MIRVIKENLARQHKALLLLKTLLQEEFSSLTKTNPQKVAGLELSIQKLMRQLIIEKLCLKANLKKVNPGFDSIKKILPTLSDEAREGFMDILMDIDSAEQEVAVQAAKNNKMVKALMAQNRKLLDCLYNQIKPKYQDAYSAKGRFTTPNSEPRILRGRL